MTVKTDEERFATVAGEQQRAAGSVNLA